MQSFKEKLNPSPDGFFYCASCGKTVSMIQISRGEHVTHILYPCISLSYIEKIKNVLGLYA